MPPKPAASFTVAGCKAFFWGKECDSGTVRTKKETAVVYEMSAEATLETPYGRKPLGDICISFQRGVILNHIASHLDKSMPEGENLDQIIS